MAVEFNKETQGCEVTLKLVISPQGIFNVSLLGFM